MTLREKILKTFVVTIREINTHGGPKEFFEKYPVGGMFYGEHDVFYDDNGMEIGTATTFERLNECKQYSKNKLLVCADFASIRGQTVTCGQTSLGGTRSPEKAYDFGKSIGMQMNDKGVDWVLAPSIDMCFDHLMYLTAISDSPEVTAEIYREVVRGIQDQGVCATVKHFPGLGTNFVNMHIGPGANVLPFDEWMATYGYTYKEMFKENVMSVMTTHVSLKSYDNELSEGFYPTATFSEKLTTNLLKRELGFDGVVVTDALIMGGMATGDLIAETVKAFKAGADVLLWPPVEAAEKIEEAILNGEIPMSRLDDALARIEKLENFRNEALKNHAYDTPDKDFVNKTLYEIAEQGICLLKNDINLIPLNKEKHKKVLIVDATQNETLSKGSYILAKEFEKYGICAEVQRDIYDVPSRVCWQADIDKLQSQYDLVLFHLDAEFATEWSVPHMLIWASHLFDKSKKLIVNCRSPYFAIDYFPEDPTFVEMNISINENTAKMLVERLMGEKEFTGKCLLTKYERKA